MRIFLCVCVMLVGCGDQQAATPGVGNDQPGPVLAELADEALQKQVSEIMDRNDQEMARLIQEGQAAGKEQEVRGAVGRLIVASNAHLVEMGDLSAARWMEEQLRGKTPAQLIAAFPDK